MNFPKLNATLLSLSFIATADIGDLASAHAQEQTQAQPSQVRSKTMLEEVHVTARKRSENIQETPVAVTAIGSLEIQERGILNAKGLAKIVPSLQIVEGQSNQIFLRGVGQLSGLVRQNPSVSAYLDGVFIPRADGQLMDTIDVENIQVLRGPQGTLFGKNNTGGALVFTLTKPTDTHEGYVQGSMGSYDLTRGRAVANVPLSDNLFTRFAINTQRRNGYLEDPASNDNSSLDRWSTIAQTRWDASDTLTLDTFAFYGMVRERSPSYNCRVISEDSLLGGGLGLLWAGDTDPSEPRAYRENCEANDRRFLPDLTTNQGPSQRQNRELETLMLGATFDWQFESGNNLKVILGHRDATKTGPKTASDDGGPAEYLKALTLGKGEQLSTTLELQFSGTALHNKLDYTMGFFGQYEEKSEKFLSSNALVGIDLTSLAAIALGEQPNPATILPGGTNPPVVGAFLTPDRLQDFDISEETFAAFIQGTYHITEHLEFTLGGRYTEATTRSDLVTRETDIDELNTILGSDLRFTVQDPGMGLHIYNGGTWADDPIAIANSLFDDPDGDLIRTPLGAPRRDNAEASFSEFTPMASVSYFVPESPLIGTPIDSALIYFTWSNGFKSGFLEPKGADGLVTVKPELLENFELGTKFDLFNSTLRVNAAIYEMYFDNMQLITVGVDSTNSLVVTSTNAGRSKINGAELEVSWLPVANLLISLSYSNNNYQFLEYQELDLLDLVLGTETVVDRSDENFPKSPEQTAALGVQYSWRLAGGTLTPRVDVSYTGEIYHGFDNGAWDARKTNPDSVMADEYTLIDARVSWENQHGDLRIAAWINNVSDERYLNGWNASADSVGNFVEIVGEPRMYGIEVQKRF